MVSHKKADRDAKQADAKAKDRDPAELTPSTARASKNADAEAQPSSEPGKAAPRRQASPSIKKTSPEAPARAAASTRRNPDPGPAGGEPPAGEPPKKRSASKAAKALEAAKLDVSPAPPKKPAARKSAPKKTADQAPPPAPEPPAAKAEPVSETPHKPAAKRKATKALEAAKLDVPASPAPKKRAPARKAAPAKKAEAASAEPAPEAPAPAPAAPKATRRTAARAERIAAAANVPPGAGSSSTPPAPEPSVAAMPGDEPIPGRPVREAAPPAAAQELHAAYVQPEALPPSRPGEGGEGASKIVLMIRDPEWLYAYWEISNADREAHAIGQPHGAPPLLLRVSEVRGDGEPVDTGNVIDVTIIPDASGWYVHVAPGGGQWRASLGYLDYEGGFVSIARSNVVSTPSPILETWGERAWGPVVQELQTLESAAGLEQSLGLPEPGLAELEDAEGQPPSSLVQRAARVMAYLRRHNASEQFILPGASEQLQALRPGASEQLPSAPGVAELGQALWFGASEQVQRLGASEQVMRPGASEQFLRPGASEQAAGQPAVAAAPGEKTFWLQVYTELIVYGATEPDASVTVQGQPIRLRPDGTFTLRFALPDGEQVIPVHAVNADGDMERTITPIVKKRTV